MLEALEEHHLVKLTLAELETMDPSHERYGAKVTVLIENVRHHVKEEESELFPSVRNTLDPAQLREIGNELVAAKRTAPTRPHPEAPDTPPGNIVAQVLTAPLDVAANLNKAASASSCATSSHDHGAQRSLREHGWRPTAAGTVRRTQPGRITMTAGAGQAVSHLAAAFLLASALSACGWTTTVGCRGGVAGERRCRSWTARWMPLDSTGGGPTGTVLNNQPTSPAVDNAPPGDDGTG